MGQHSTNMLDIRTRFAVAADNLRRAAEDAYRKGYWIDRFGSFIPLAHLSNQELMQLRTNALSWAYLFGTSIGASLEILASEPYYNPLEEELARRGIESIHEELERLHQSHQSR